LIIKEDVHFLGYGIACVVLPHSGGMGPEILPGPMQRDLVLSEVRNLWVLGGRDEAKKLLRFDPKHALIHGVSGKLLDQSSLNKDRAGPFKAVAWMREAPQSKAYVYAGQHRTAALEMALKPTLQELEEVQKKLINDQDNQDLIDKQRSLIKILKEKGTWLVEYYDTGGSIYIMMSW
jgi:hypothetical protein